MTTRRPSQASWLPTPWASSVAPRRRTLSWPRSTMGAGSGPLAEPSEEPLLVWSEALREYDFGPGHPLTPRRFGPGIDLLRAVGATRTMAPDEADDAALARLHAARYIEQVRSFSDHPWQPAAMGIGTPDVPAFHGMHEASARVAGGSIGAVEAHPRGARPSTPSRRPAACTTPCARGRPASASTTTSRSAWRPARDAGHRVLYVDLDVHHGDGTQALFWDDPEVLTFSIHETGQHLFPGTGAVDETGGEDAPGTAVNTPLEPGSGDESWWPVVELMLPALAEAFRPTFIVSQHGCDSHALDPLAHLRVTTAVLRACLRAHRPTRASSTAAGAGWRPAAGATTPTAWCRARGPSSGWRRRTPTCPRRRRPTGANDGRSRPAASGRRPSRRSSSTRRGRVSGPGTARDREPRARRGRARDDPPPARFRLAAHPLRRVHRGDRHRAGALERAVPAEAARASAPARRQGACAGLRPRWCRCPATCRRGRARDRTTAACGRRRPARCRPA